ncbi:hypothetical protein BT63DRAFT_414210 [Microthyrium microscopicum]|uniref:BHLH domain-containing protein n=1 Tax=Microthyrium microscopicum TaxID=703497 RepID=A0A6A6U7E9_9PEZI|nr:hypothetical protein BT63DRAFT_414210 [Microthyrium microscopicum]
MTDQPSYIPEYATTTPLVSPTNSSAFSDAAGMEQQFSVQNYNVYPVPNVPDMNFEQQNWYQSLPLEQTAPAPQPTPKHHLHHQTIYQVPQPAPLNTAPVSYPQPANSPTWIQQQVEIHHAPQLPPQPSPIHHPLPQQWRQQISHQQMEHQVHSPQTTLSIQPTIPPSEEIQEIHTTSTSPTIHTPTVYPTRYPSNESPISPDSSITSPNTITSPSTHHNTFQPTSPTTSLPSPPRLPEKRKRGRPRLPRPDPDPTKPKPPRVSRRQPHNQVERKYREGLNAEMDRLRAAIPPMPAEPASNNNSAGQKPSKAQVLQSAVVEIQTLKDKLAASEARAVSLAAENGVLKGRLERLVKGGAGVGMGMVGIV